MSALILLLTLCCLTTIVFAEDQYMNIGSDCNQDPVVLVANYGSPPIPQPPMYPQPPIQQSIPGQVESFEFPIQPLPPQQPLPVNSFNPQQLMPFRQQTLYTPQNNVFYIIPVPYPLRERKSKSHEDIEPEPESTEEKDKPNQCPPETKRDCFRAVPYKGCEVDIDCDGTHKCCFDTCLDQLVCKPPVP